MTEVKTQTLKLSEIITDAGTQTRCCTTDDVVSEYAERWVEGDKFPPVIVFHDGAGYYLADGFHRYLAAQRNEFKDILAEVHKGTIKDALKYALGANRANGLRRTNADKRRCVWLALENFSNQSDRAIADMCGVGNKFVGDVRGEQEQLCSKHSSPAPRTGKDGKTRKMPERKETLAPLSEPEEPPRVESADEKVRETYCWGLQYADLAIDQLKKIHRKDEQRDAAFDLVTNWINKNRK